jgi:hypothetical protein
MQVGVAFFLQRQVPIHEKRDEIQTEAHFQKHKMQSVAFLAVILSLAAPLAVGETAPSSACLNAANTLIQCHLNGPAGSTGWVPPDLENLRASVPVQSNPICCRSNNLHDACGTAENFFSLWTNPAMFSPEASSILIAYIGTCPAGTRGSIRFDSLVSVVVRMLVRGRAPCAVVPAVPLPHPLAT